MTDLLGGAGQSEMWLEADCKRAVSTWYLAPYMLTELYPVPSAPVGSHRTPHWPGGGRMLGDAGDISPIGSVSYVEPDLTRGCSQQFGITGITRDVYGTPLSFVSVKLYLTATDVVQSKTISDANGAFLVTTGHYPDLHYLVFYKAGSPDIFATSQNTLVAG